MLIKSIQIERFRCFHKTKAQDFGRVNLLGGKNNAGKTAFLEALFLMNEPSNRTIQALLHFRGEDIATLKSMPSRAWDNFFYNRIKTNIVLSEQLTDKTIYSVKVHCFDKNAYNYETRDIEDLNDFRLDLFDKKAIESTLEIRSDIADSDSNLSVTLNDLKGNGYMKTYKSTQFIPSDYKRSNESLAQALDNIKLQGGTEHLLRAFCVIDKSIEEITTINIGKPTIYIRRKGENHYMPLSLYGDAMNKVADFILRIINNKSSLLLIDEIENGIHHSNQQALWKLIFELAIMYDVQLFATTHSAEMIEAFKNVVIENSYQEEARYFELSRHAISKEIMVQKLSIGVLEDKLNHKKPLRGE